MLYKLKLELNKFRGNNNCLKVPQQRAKLLIRKTINFKPQPRKYRKLKMKTFPRRGKLSILFSFFARRLVLSHMCLYT